MLDFTSALYLGLRHGSTSLGPWEALSLGRPAILQEPPGARTVARQLAGLLGFEAATLLPSTLHLFRDLFRVLAGERDTILVDACAYPIARWGAEHGCPRRSRILSFGHNDADALAGMARRAAQEGRRPIVVCDGYCPACGVPAPLGDYAECAARHGGYVVVDDTQALGILGESPVAEIPFGVGGGGSARWHNVSGPHVVVGASLAKGFGVPVAVLAGARPLIRRFLERSDTLVHCSPPSVVAIHAAQQALEVNRRHGELLRQRLWRLVTTLRSWALHAGLRLSGRTRFPVQMFRAPPNHGALRLHEQLITKGVRTVVTRACDGLANRLTFVVTARHRMAEIDFAGRMLAACTGAAESRAAVA